jgi:hypothetical protein
MVEFELVGWCVLIFDNVTGLSRVALGAYVSMSGRVGSGRAAFSLSGLLFSPRSCGTLRPTRQAAF